MLAYGLHPFLFWTLADKLTEREMEMNAIRKLIKQWIAKQFGYCLYVPEFNGFHYELKLSELRDWVMQYPANSQMYVMRRGKCI